jgi:hypothetical protein
MIAIDAREVAPLKSIENMFVNISNSDIPSKY